MNPRAPNDRARPRPGLPPKQQQDVIDAEMRASRRGVLAAFHRRLLTDPETLAAEDFLALADRHIVRTAIVVVAARVADACTLHTFDPVSGALRTVRHSGLSLRLRDALTAFLTACGVGPAAVDPFVVDDLAADPGPSGRPVPESLLAAGFRAVQAYPLRNRHGEPLGVLSLQYRTAVRHPRQERLAQAAAQAMGLAPAVPTLSRRARASGPVPPGVTVTRNGDGVALLVCGALLDTATRP